MTGSFQTWRVQGQGSVEAPPWQAHVATSGQRPRGRVPVGVCYTRSAWGSCRLLRAVLSLLLDVYVQGLGLIQRSWVPPMPGLPLQ